MSKVARLVYTSKDELEQSLHDRWITGICFGLCIASLAFILMVLTVTPRCL